MLQRGSHFRKVLTVLTVTYLLNVHAATDNQQVINEINKLENMMKTLQTPPELVEAVLKQMESHCQKDNRSIDKSYLTNASKCIEQYFNVSQLANDMRAAVPEGKMDTVFRDICVKWPKVKACVKDFFDIVDECWQQGNKIDSFISHFVKFYCGEDNSGERIALFFAEGGLECVQEHGEEVKKCIESKQKFDFDEEKLQNPEELQNLDISKIPIPKKDEICENIDQLHECFSLGLRKCKDPTPENLMTSMLKQVGKELECKVSEINLRQTSDGSDAAGNLVQSLALPLAIAIGLLAL